MAISLGTLANDVLLSAVEEMITEKFTDVILRLNTTDMVHDPNRPANDYTVPTFDGYSEKTINPVGVPDFDDGKIVQVLTPAFWQATSVPNSPQVIFGWFIVDGNETVLAAGKLDHPISILDVNDFIAIYPAVYVSI